MAAVERVQVVEADREGRTEPLGDGRAEHPLALERHEQLEPDLDGLVGAEQDPALGRDQLVRPCEVRRVGWDAEPAPEPLPAPRAWEERRTRAKRPAGEVVQGQPERVARHRPGPGGVAHVQEPVDDRRQLTLVPVEDRPVDEKQTLLGSGLPLGLAEVARGPAAHRFQRLCLREVGVPEEVVADERAARAVDEHDVAGGRGWQPVEQVGEPAVAEPCEDRVAGQLGAGGPSQNLGPRREARADVEHPRAQRGRERDGELLPRHCSRAVERDDPRGAPLTLGVERLEPDVDLDRSRAGSAAQGRTSRRRSSVSDALHEKSRLPSASPVVGS